MLRFLFFLILVYLLYRIVKILIRPLFRPKSRKENMYEPPKGQQKDKKIIPKEEGEYVDFEEMDENKK